MLFAHDTEFALLTAAALVNTAANGRDTLSDPGELEQFLVVRRESGEWTGTAAELGEVIELRGRLRDLWQAPDVEAAADLVNALLRSSDLKPQLTDHDGHDWHLHAADAGAPLAQRMKAELAMAFAELIRARATDRLRICDAPECDAVLVDLSRNHSRRYCDTGNCGNRLHVAAYRARKATRLIPSMG